MKSVTSTCTIAAVCISALMTPVWLSAQDAGQNHEARHHHYKVIEMGTFGGPASSIDATGDPPNSFFNKVLTRSGAMLGGADTPIPDPDEFAGPFVNYAFRWANGVQSNLGVLPQNPALGVQAPCFNCAWSTFAFWMADNGFVAGESTDNAVDPLTGFPTSLAVLWKYQQNRQPGHAWRRGKRCVRGKPLGRRGWRRTNPHARFPTVQASLFRLLHLWIWDRTARVSLAQWDDARPGNLRRPRQRRLLRERQGAGRWQQ